MDGEKLQNHKKKCKIITSEIEKYESEVEKYELEAEKLLNVKAPNIFFLKHRDRMVGPNQPFYYIQINANKILDGLFIGNQEAAQEIDFITSIKCANIINCAGHSVPNNFIRLGIRYLTLRWLDCKTQVLFDSNMKTFRQIMKFIDPVLNKGQAVLIHSRHGNSRAVCVVAVYLMSKYGWSVTKAIEFIRFKRPEIAPKPYFIKQLKKFGKKLKITEDEEESAAEKIRDNKNNNENFEGAMESRWLNECKTLKEALVRNTFLNGHYIFPPSSDPHMDNHKPIQDLIHEKQFKLRFNPNYEIKKSTTNPESHSNPIKSILKKKNPIEMPAYTKSDSKNVPQYILNQQNQQNQQQQMMMSSTSTLNVNIPTSPSPREFEESQPLYNKNNNNLHQQHQKPQKFRSFVDHKRQNLAPMNNKKHIRNNAEAWSNEEENHFSRRQQQQYYPQQQFNPQHKRSSSSLNTHVKELQVIGFRSAWENEQPHPQYNRGGAKLNGRRKKSKRKKKRGGKNQKSTNKNYKPKTLKTTVRLKNDHNLHGGPLFHSTLNEHKFHKRNKHRTSSRGSSSRESSGGLSRAQSADDLLMRMKKIKFQQKKKRMPSQYKRPSSAASSEFKKRQRKLVDPGIMVFGKLI